MKCKELRRYIKEKNLHKSHSLENCQLVIDVDNLFKDSYKESGCQFVLGPDCDQYAAYLQSKLACFVTSRIICYAIFKGTTKDNEESRQKYHQSIIDHRREVTNKLYNPSYFEPLFVKDVQKQILEKMGIKYFCCEYDSIEAIVGVARTFKCPVLTGNVEYCLYGVSCILPKSIQMGSNQEIQCTIFEHDLYKSAIGVYKKTPILLAMSLVENNNDINCLIRLVKQHKDLAKLCADRFKDESKKTMLLELYKRIEKLYLYPLCHSAVKYFQRDRPRGLFKDDKKWFSEGVSNGRISTPHIDLKRKGFVTGSTVLYDVCRPDAMAAATQIIAYTHCLLTNSQESTLTFNGRKNNTSTTWNVETCWKTRINNREIFTKYGTTKPKKNKNGIKPSRLKDKVSNIYEYDLFENPFSLFIEEVMSTQLALKWQKEENSISIFEISRVPKKALILFITLVYYVKKINKSFINGAYCIFLCYVMLSTASGLEEKEEQVDKKYYGKNNALKFLFDKVDLKRKYNASIVHSLAEFQHCLQHMNYLYTLCKYEYSLKAPSTIYHETYNATFVYNTLMFMKSKNQLMSFLEINIGRAPWISYKDIVSEFEKYLQL